MEFQPPPPRSTARQFAATLGSLLLLLLVGRSADGQGQGVSSSERAEETLRRARHHGHALLEMGSDPSRAVEAWRRSVELAPRSVHDRLGLALALEQAGEIEAALEALAAVHELEPDRAEVWFHQARLLGTLGQGRASLEALGTLLRLAPEDPLSHLRAGDLALELGDGETALRHYEASAALAPLWADPQWRLSDLHRLADRPGAADRARERAIELGEEGRHPPAEPFPFFFVHEPAVTVGSGNLDLPNFEPRRVDWGGDDDVSGLEDESGPGARALGLVLLDADGDGGMDLLVLTSAGPRLVADGLDPRPGAFAALRGGIEAAGESRVGMETTEGSPAEQAAEGGAGPEAPRGGRFVLAVPGDVDGDDLSDLCLLDDRGRPWLLRNEGGRFSLVGVPLPSGPFAQARWLDVEDDGDLDLLLLGARPALLINDGVWTLIDRSHRFPFVDGHALAAAVLDAGIPGPGAPSHDLAVVHTARRGVRYRDRGDGHYEAELLGGVPLALTEALGYDANLDGRSDLLVSNPSMAVLFLADRLGGFRRAASMPGGHPPVLWVDFRGIGLADLVAGGQVHVNRGGGRLLPPVRPRGWPGELRAVVAADWVGEGRAGDGHLDLAVIDGRGDVLMLRNTSSRTASAFTVEARGEITLGAVIEVMAGTLYSKHLIDGSGTPSHFALGGRALADVVRITWSDGRRDHRLDVAAGERLVVGR